MAELPPPDLMDSTGRARRIVLSLLIGAAAGGLAYFLANLLIAPETGSAMRVSSRQMDRGTFVIYIGLIASVVSFVVALAVQNRMAKAKWEREQVPAARVR